MPVDPIVHSGNYIEYEHLVGRQIFGKPNRMLAGIWIQRLDTEHAQKFWASEFFDWCVKSGRKWVSQPNSDFQKYESLGMIEETHRDRAVYYRRLYHPMWDFFTMLDVALSEVETPGQRRFYTPTPERIERMIGDLVRIHAGTEPLPLPEILMPVVPTTVAKPSTAGPVRCSRCNRLKKPNEFSKRRSAKGIKSRCKECMAEIARIRYLSMSKVEALNAVGVSFVIAAADDVIGLACVDCGQPFLVGQEVAGHTRLWHTSCPLVG